MAKKGGGSAASPDPAATAAAQGAVNRETAVAQSRLNQVNEYTPYGSSVYTPTGETVDGIERMQRTTTLSPDQQAILDQQTGISTNLNTLASDQLGRVSDSLANPYSYEGMPSAPTADAAARQQTIDSLYGQFTSRLDPRFQQDQTALETQLQNQGLSTGSEAYNQAMESFGRTKNDAYTSAQNQAVVGGGAEQSRLFGLQGNERERAIQEYSTQRNAPLNEVSALLGSGPGITNPTFSPTPQTGVAGSDITALTSANAQRAQQSSDATMGGLYGLVGTGLSAAASYYSDRRVKKDIKKVGTLDNGLPVYAYEYVWGGGQHIGLIAQDVEKLHPGAVGEVNGIKTVNYAEAVR